MKTFYQLALSLCLLHISPIAEAQLLKKLKDKTNEQINKVTGVKSDETTTTTASGQNTGNSSSTGLTSDQLKDVESTMIYQLAEGERIDYRESRIMIGAGNKISGLVIVDKSGARYVVENGIKKGPFPAKSVPLDFLKKNQDDENQSPEGYDSNEMLNVYQNYVKSDDDKNYILFNGKKSVPFSLLEAMKVNPQKTKYIALISNDISDEQKEKYLINQDGKKVLISKSAQLTGQMVVSPTFNDAAFWGMDIGNSYAEGTIKTVFATLNGTTQIISPQLNSVWYDPNGHLITVNDKAIFLNGKEIKENSTSISSSWKDIWINEKGTAWVALINNKLIFSSGEAIEDGFNIKSVNQNGKTIINWIAVSKQSHAIISYSKSI
ncbi:hypothetical protein [Solitalea canadensis]|uniref:Uncharacterized protein n=1 Tax=Solitalea canadensis (strain ATCC 29591 / DSM 3403 / JCM 21819 / LMG 8368 / NBRC 15130 / NCIMB 12057 / USAM 9D) TaxID=929556 RepID=H8KNC4_SOLCM|nr:hypothetical protein [Solitalea canadensis]AFD09457.1 hypothetical protein Solca_4467 [Solitalea canadensis DSM 3403]